MKCKSLTVCETYLVDSSSNNVSLINLIEEFNLPGLPTVIPKLTVVAQLERESMDENEAVSLKIKANMNDIEIFEQPIMADFKGKSKTRVFLEINGLPLNDCGVLKFLLVENGTEALEYSIEIKTPDLPKVQVRQG